MISELHTLNRVELENKLLMMNSAGYTVGLKKIKRNSINTAADLYVENR